jgi:hypothetical protein
VVKRVQHMVLLKFKPAVSAERITAVFQELSQLKQLIPGIEHFAGGPYSSPEGLDGGFTHGFLMTFRDASARNTYLAHPEHERVKQGILPGVASVIAFDFEE